MKKQGANEGLSDALRYTKIIPITQKDLDAVISISHLN